MKTSLTLSIGFKELRSEGFDSDKEIGITIEDMSRDSTKTINLSPNQVNSLINHLSAQLMSIGEPVELLDAK